MGDENIYLMANKELESGDKDHALWIKALAIVGGDEERTKHQLIALPPLLTAIIYLR